MASSSERVLSHETKTKVLTQDQAARSVVVTNIAPETPHGKVIIYFQRQRNGGGEIVNVHIPEKGTAVITFESIEVAESVLKRSHMLEGSKLELHQFIIPKESPEVFQNVEARVNFDKFNLLPQESQNMLEILTKNTKVAYRKSSKEFFVFGTFSQVAAAHKLLQCLIEQHYSVQKMKEGKEGMHFGTFEVQPQFMKLLKRVYKKNLQDIKETFCLEIVWTENTSQVRIIPKKMSSRQNRFQEGCDAFIDLYQKFHPNMGREVVELPTEADDDLIFKAISSVEGEDPVIIEKVDKTLVVYAEKNSISSSVQSLKEKLGFTHDGSGRKTRRGQRNKSGDAREDTETSLAQHFNHVLNNGVNLSLYQGDITDERVDAIVNAANEWLQHGAGVAAAIVRKGGRGIQDESNRLTNWYGPLAVGGAAYTGGGNLTCRYVIHTVGPEWKKHGKDQSISLLRQACIETLRLAAGCLHLSSIALTAISSGIFGMPKEICAQIMFSAVEEFSSSKDAEFSTLRDVRIVIIDEPTISVFQEVFVKRYLPQEASPETVATQGRPSDDYGATPPTPNTKLGERESKGKDSFPSMDQTQTEDKRPDDELPDVDSPSVPADREVENSGKRAVPDSIKHTSLSNQATKASQPTSAKPPKTEGNEVSHDLNHNDSGPMERSNKSDRSAVTKPLSGGRGRGNFAPRFQNPPGSSTLNGNTHLQGTIADAGRGRGVISKDATTTTLPPGLAVTEEGKKFARYLDDHMEGDKTTGVDESVEDKNQAKIKTKCNSETLKEVSQTQEAKRNKTSTDGEKPNEESTKTSPNDLKTLSQPQFNSEHASGNNSPSGDDVTDPNKTMKVLTETSVIDDEGRNRPTVEKTEDIKPSHDPSKDVRVKTNKPVKQVPDSVTDARNDEALSSQHPATGNEMQTDHEDLRHSVDEVDQEKTEESKGSTNQDVVLTSTATEEEMQSTVIESSTQDESTTSCPRSPSDPEVSRQSVDEVDKEKAKESRHSTNQDVVLTSPATEEEMQTVIESSTQDESTTSCPRSPSDPEVSRQSVDEVDKEKAKESRHSTNQDAVEERRDDIEGCTTQDSEAGPPPLYEMQANNRTSEPNCLMCMNFNNEPVSLSQCERGHYYCKSCIKGLLRKSKICPQCQKEDFSQGNQPIGCMSWKTTAQYSLPGYHDCGIIVIYFVFDEGIQGSKHPRPGTPYKGLSTTALLPCNKAGLEVCSLLKRAFDARLIFTIGTSPANGEENEIVWNCIELKTSKSGGPANYGYPDPNYLDRVKKQLAEKGITQSTDEASISTVN